MADTIAPTAQTDNNTVPRRSLHAGGPFTVSIEDDVMSRCTRTPSRCSYHRSSIGSVRDRPGRSVPHPGRDPPTKDRLPSGSRRTAHVGSPWPTSAPGDATIGGGPMESTSRRPGGRTPLLGRAAECAVLDGLIDDIRRGESRSLVLRGEPGIGKTALVEHLVESAFDLRVVRAVGVESEMELAYASLHQLCAPLLDRLERLPAPQRQALDTIFALSAGPTPDRFLVGLAVLSLFSEVADERPLLCVVDDAQWLDQASALTLSFVARRLQADRIGIVFAARELGDALQHLPEMEVQGVRNGAARALLSSAVRFQLDERVRDRIIAEMRGNPLALLELPRGLTATQLAGGFGALGARDLSGRIEKSFVRQLEVLPVDARRLLVLAAAEPLGDPLLLWRAAAHLGIPPSAADDVEAHGLLAIGERV